MDCRGLGVFCSRRYRMAPLFSAWSPGVGDAFFDWLSGMGMWVQTVAVKV